MELRITPTQVRQFLEAKENSGKTEISRHYETSRGIGNLFHSYCRKLVEDCANNVVVLDNVKDADAIASQLVCHFQPMVEGELKVLRGNSQAESRIRTMDAWRCFVELIYAWAPLVFQNSEMCEQSKLLSLTFPILPKTAQVSIEAAGGIRVLLSGEPDAIAFDARKKRFVVAEYKTYVPVNDLPVRAQAACYAKMVQTASGVECIDAMIFLAGDGLHTFSFSHEYLQETWEHELPRIFAEMLKPKPTQPVFERPLPSEPSEAAQKLLKLLLQMKFDCKWVSEEEGPSFRRIRVKPEATAKIGHLLSLEQNIQIALELSAAPLCGQDGCEVFFDLQKKQRTFPLFEDVMAKSANLSEFSIPFGVDVSGKLVLFSLNDTAICHILVGGTTGSGKSEFLKSVLAGLAWNTSPQRLELIVIDPKRISLGVGIARLPHLKRGILSDMGEAIQALQDLIVEMERRYALFEHDGVQNWHEYVLRHPKELFPKILCVVEEFADFMLMKEYRKDVEFCIQKLAQKSRACGIHLLLATQRPDKQTIPSAISNNLPARVILQTTTEFQSRIVAGRQSFDDGVNLLGKGDLFLLAPPANPLRLQSLYVSDEYLAQPRICL